MSIPANALCATGKVGPSLSVNAARLRATLAAVPVRETETVPLLNALGRVAGSLAPAKIDLPPFDNAAMDGFALNVADLTGAGPWRLPVTGRTAAGDTSVRSLRTGAAVRILTGAPVPVGANAVVMQERVTNSGAHILLADRPKPGANIRRRGEDRQAGEPSVPLGHVLTAPRLALLAATGIDAIEVFRPLRVGLFSTGDELREPGEALKHGQIYNSNRVMLRALLALPWVHLTDYGILRDDPACIRDAIRLAAVQNDVVISSGGVSAGEEDHILDALRREDATLDVLKIAIRPGKPLTVGRVGHALYVGLPGNPYAAIITFTQIARPALRKSAGITETPETWIPAVADFAYDRLGARTEYVPVTWEARDQMGRPMLHRLGAGSSASLGPIAFARGIALLPPDATQIRKGSPLAVEPLIE